MAQVLLWCVDVGIGAVRITATYIAECQSGVLMHVGVDIHLSIITIFAPRVDCHTVFSCVIRVMLVVAAKWVVGVVDPRISQKNRCLFSP